MFEMNLHIYETEAGKDNPDLRFCAFNEELREQIFAGYGKTPCEALHDFINGLQEAEIFRGDNE